MLKMSRIDKIMKCFKLYKNVRMERHKQLSKSLKNYILIKYNYTCAGNIPGHPCTYNIREALEVDHILPRSIVCVHKKYNLQVLCSNCHSLKTRYYDAELIQKFKAGTLKDRHVKKHLDRFM